MSQIKLMIDGKEAQVEAGSSILQAAQSVGIEIPTLCYLNLHETPMKNDIASCRVCVVEVEGRRNLAPACATPVVPDMVVHTCTKRVFEARKTVVELLLSDHPKDCLNCVKAEDCELLELATKLGIRASNWGGEVAQSTYEKDTGVAIVRDMNKCIMCRRCETMCSKVQGVGALSGVDRGFEASVAPPFGLKLEETICSQCGQCVAVCPTGALTEREYIDDVMKALWHPKKKVAVQVAPAVRVALAEAFGMEVGTLATGKLVTALKQMGFDYVFDTDFAADVTIMEEGYELIKRLTDAAREGSVAQLPILTSCCPAWVNYFETHYKDLLDLPSTARSPQQIMGAIVKSYFAQKMGLEADHLVMVSIMPCIAKKYEAARPELGKDVDIALTTREFARLIKKCNINWNQLEESTFDDPLGESTGAAVIFGTTGGVMEAALRTAYEKVTGEGLQQVEFEAVRGLEGIREATIKMGEMNLNVAVVHGLANAKKVMEEIREGNPRQWHAIEVMACPGGCIGGAGQPYHHGDIEVIKRRQEAIYADDRCQERRKSHENPSVLALYHEYLKNPLSHKAHELLHTHYEGKDRV